LAVVKPLPPARVGVAEGGRLKRRMAAARFAFPIFLAGSSMLSAGPLLVRLADVDPLASAFWRLALAAPFLLLLGRIADRGAPLLPSGGRWWLALAGIAFAADLAVWHLGIERTTLANATMLANSTAFLFPVWGYVVARRLPSPTAMAALVLAALGLALLMGQSASVSAEHVAGDLLCFAAAVFYTVYLVAMDRARGGLGALAALGPATVVAALALLPLAAIAPGAFWPHDWTPILLLALGSQVIGQGLIVFALPHLSPLASGVGLLIQPVFSAMLGFLWYEERLTALDLAAVAILFAAILIVRRPSMARPPVEKRVPPEGGGVMPPGPPPAAA
jgi:drug/metabolite transporter (DMT)-like permease